MRLSDLQNKDIVNVNDGKNIGSIIDVKIDETSGNIVSLNQIKIFLNFLIEVVIRKLNGRVSLKLEKM